MRFYSLDFLAANAVPRVRLKRTLEFPFRLRLRSLTPAVLRCCLTPLLAQAVSQYFRCWEQGIVIRAAVSPSLVVSPLQAPWPFSIFPFLHPLFASFYFFYFASVSRQCCAACRSVQRPWCRASPPPGGPLDAGWKRPPQILHGWPSGNSGSCSLSILGHKKDTTDH